MSRAFLSTALPEGFSDYYIVDSIDSRLETIQPARMRYTLAIILCILLLQGSGLREPSLEVVMQAYHAPGERSDHTWSKLTYPHFAYDAEAYTRSLQQAVDMRAAPITHRFGAWESVGPTNAPGGITDIEIDPEQPDVAYAASVGGVYKSLDFGETWASISDDIPVRAVGDIAIDPSNPQIIYAGTGEPNAIRDSRPGGGVYKSEDSGRTWRYSGLAATSSVGRILIDPRYSNRVFVAAPGELYNPNPDRGVYRSSDGGQSWEHVLSINDSTGVIDLVMNPKNPDILFAAAWERMARLSHINLNGKATGIYRSEDGGDTWTELGRETGLPAGETMGRIGLAICRDFPETMYARYTRNRTFHSLYRTEDGGKSWTEAGDPGIIKDLLFLYSVEEKSYFFGQVRVAPSNPDLVYFLDRVLLRSDNGGKDWEYERHRLRHFHALAFDPQNTSRILTGLDGGTLYRLGRDSSWTRGGHMDNTQFNEVAFDPSNSAQLFGGAQDHGALASRGRRDNWGRLAPWDVYYMVADPTDPRIVYVGLPHGWFIKFGRNWYGARNAGNGIYRNSKKNRAMPLIMDPHDRLVLYTGAERVYRTSNGAERWHPISPRLTGQVKYEKLGTITTIAVAPTNSDIIYAGTDNGHLWVTTDLGGNWNRISDSLPERWITRVVADPLDERTAYVTFSGWRWGESESHVFRTDDQGQTWDDISGNLPEMPVNAFAVDPVKNNVVFAGTDAGAYVSITRGMRWEALSEGMPLVTVVDMKIFFDGVERFLLAGTHGRSMFTLDLAETGTATSPEVGSVAKLEFLQTYPNPFTGSVTVEYHLDQASTVDLEVYDLTGRRVAKLVSRHLGEGEHRSTWQPNGLSAGTYIVRLSAVANGQRVVRTSTLQYR